MYRVSQIIASTKSNFLWKNDSHTIVVGFMDDCNIDSLLKQLSSNGSHSGKNLSLRFENLKGNDLLPVIDIYLNLEQENTPKEKNYVGSMGLYGLAESSIESPGHDGSGQHRIFDVGQVFNSVCTQANWSEKQFKLTLMPYNSLSTDATLAIGRILLYFYES